jgi:ferredoxin like protein
MSDQHISCGPDEQQPDMDDIHKEGGSCERPHRAAMEYRPPTLNVTAQLGLTKFKPDESSHLSIRDREICRHECRAKYCAHSCPAQVYRWEEEEQAISIAFEGCLECGTCRSGGCPFDNIEMNYPRGGNGVQYRFG